MIKKIFTIFVGCLVFLSCTNNEGEKKVTTNNEAASAQEKLLQNAYNAYPDSTLLLEKLVQYYRDNENYNDAITTINKAIKKDSLNDRLWDIKAILHTENADTVAAISAFEKAIQILPNPKYILSVGTLYAQTKNEKALQVADALLLATNSKTEKEAIFLKGLFYNYTNNKKKAIDYFNQCLALDYTFMLAYREKAIALYDLQQYSDAITVLDKAVTLQNNFDEGYFWLGKCFEKNNNIAAAIESYQTANIYCKKNTGQDYVEAMDALSKLGIK
jgi:tetratricopeptide (TPR) repeat protein